MTNRVIMSKLRCMLAVNHYKEKITLGNFYRLLTLTPDNSVREKK